MGTNESESDGRDRFAGVPGVDPETAELLASAEVRPDDFVAGDVSHRELVDAGVAREAAARLRREHSLPWSFELGVDLSERSAAVENLSSSERDWIAASDGEWQDREFESVLSEPADEGPDFWDEHDRPTPVERVSGVGPADADGLADAGVTSARQLSFAPAGELASLLDRDVRQVRLWRHAARALTDRS